MALEQGKDVYALPGPVNSHLSRGCNLLIKQGAGVLLSPEEFMSEIGISKQNQKENNQQKKLLLETTENMVYSCLDFSPKNLEELIQTTKLPVATLLNVIMSLELQGFVREIAKNHYVKMI